MFPLISGNCIIKLLICSFSPHSVVPTLTRFFLLPFFTHTFPPSLPPRNMFGFYWFYSFFTDKQTRKFFFSLKVIQKGRRKSNPFRRLTVFEAVKSSNQRSIKVLLLSNRKNDSKQCNKNRRTRKPQEGREVEGTNFKALSFDRSAIKLKDTFVRWNWVFKPPVHPRRTCINETLW